ncbi:hypothetical protein RUM44_011696 [Polyplax serrata]|uniref:J domain-containing protein n=1 Tax=Polyplax serrata TaxID=468196 RepID=A0ABR1AQT2_POLSC
MTPLSENEDLACFYVTKHSPWKGKYKRVFSVGTMGITTYNPSSLEVTNKWLYSEVLDIQPASSANRTEFILSFRKDKKVDSMRFSTECRSALLTGVLACKYMFSDKPKDILKCQSYKHHWSDTKLPVMLEVTPSSLNQLDLATNVVLASYSYIDIKGFSEVKDYPGGFVIICEEFSRMHLFSCDNLLELKTKILESANNIGVTIRVIKEPVTIQEFNNQRLGNYSGDEHVTSITEFIVHKISHRHQDAQRRILCLSESCILERDPQTYSICTLRPLSDIFALVRNKDNPQQFSVEYTNGDTKIYTTSDRDGLLATLLDAVRGSGNHDVHVKMQSTSRGKRWGPLIQPLEQEVESLHLKFFQQRPGNRSLSEMIDRFNANIPYSGLIHSVSQDGIFAENKEKLIHNALQALSSDDSEHLNFSNRELEAQFHALRRLFATKIGFTAFTMMPGLKENIGKKVINALKRNDEAVTHAAIDMICCLMHPMHFDYEIKQEQFNKQSILSNKVFLGKLLDMWINHINRGTAALVVSSLLDFLTFALCVPYSETTDGKDFDNLLKMVAERGRPLFRLFQHTSLAVVKGAGLVMRALIEEGESAIAVKMQNLALSEGALPRHLLNALFTQGNDSRLLAHRNLSRHLVGLWVTEHSTSMALLKRIMPVALLLYLDSQEKVPDSVLKEETVQSRDNLKLAQEQFDKNRKGYQRIAIEKQLKVIEKHLDSMLQHWGATLGIEKRSRDKEKKEKLVVLRRRRERVKSTANWTLFYYKFRQDHALPSLIWNHKTRDELRDALETEIRNFNTDRELSGNAMVAWNHQEFEVNYMSLANEVKIGEYYLRLLLENDENNESPITRSFEFFNVLYHRFLLTSKPEMKSMCLQAMSIVYGHHYKEIGLFSDTKYIIGMLDKCIDKMERDRLVIFVDKLLLDKRNIKDIMDANGVRILVDLLTLAHLHTSRAVIPTQTNVIEAGPNMHRENEKEWHYQLSGETKGPISFHSLKELWASNQMNAKSKCWAMGMDGWRTIQNVSQLKWTLLAKGNAVLNESDLAALILNILIKICENYPSRDADGAIIRPLPRVKKILSDSTCLLHIVQLLLTFDPVIVEKVATLLYLVMKDNSQISTVYLTGIFYFILMYNGSNVLPIARFLKLTHMVQAIRNDDPSASEILQRSVLGPLLPEAMLSYLENHGPDKFAQIFLGEFDTPEVIWNAEMRQLLIQKLAMHVADFSPRLRSNTRAPYQYCSIPAIRYPQLENELFCNIFYLRHLCDTARFPKWPIKEPVKLLKDVLDTWKNEVEKKPPAMSLGDAYESLGLGRGGQHDESKVRKAYYRLAQQYHPDKNPEGRNQFEKVTQAYEFLCSRSSWSGDGPNPNNIVLVLKTQSILFERYSEELEPYKYAGYPQLIKTIQLETSDDLLFSKSSPLLSAASELAYHTVQCSGLNAEELRRERGLDVLLEAYSRCVSVLSGSSKPNDVAVQVCTHITKCYSVAGRFQACRDKMVEMPQLIKDLCRILYFKHLTKLCSTATECVGSLAVDSILQMQLLQSGCLWHLLLFMFNYDYTLEEGGVERVEEANQQEVANNLAKLAVYACARMGGYLPDALASPKNELARKTLDNLITPYIARQLSNNQPEKVLKILNSNSQNPYLLWDNSTRAQLLEYLENQRTNRLNIISSEPSCGSDFQCTAYSNELKVGDIYLRLFNEQTTFPLEDPKGFVVDLLEFLVKKYDELTKSVIPVPEDHDLVKEAVTALVSLKNVIQNNSGVEVQCLGNFRLVFALLSLNNCPAVQKSALEVLYCTTKNHECVNDIGATLVLGHLLLLLFSLPDVDSQMLTLDALYDLMSVTVIVKECLAKGGLLYALHLFCNSPHVSLREKSAELIARMAADKLVGPKVRLITSRFLPAIFLDAMKESPQASIHLFDGNHENPELIWNQELRERISSFTSSLWQKFYSMQSQNANAEWTPPDDKTVSTICPNEVVVAGVYLRLFVANPGWSVRRPKEFLTELMDFCLSLMSKEKTDADLLEMSTNALVALLQTQPALGSHIPSLGHVPRFLHQMTQLRSTATSRAVVLILHQLALNEGCASAIGQTDCIMPLKKAMETRKDILGVACEALNRLFSTNSNQLVRQALESDLVPYLLTLLDRRLEVENPAMTKAQIVKALKAMARSALYGERILNILEKSPVWSAYKDQKHDLFISNTTPSGYLTGGIPTTAGYLTQGQTTLISEGPPPVDKEDCNTNRTVLLD